MSYRPEAMKFGVFMAPLHHRVGENPTLSFQEDLEFLEFLDRIDFDEAWIGEHHSGAVEPTSRCLASIPTRRAA